MNKTKLVASVAEKAGISKKAAAEALNATLDSIADALAAGEKVQLSGFGNFEVKQRDARAGFNPRTKEPVEIPASKAPIFKAGKLLKDKVN